MPIEITVIVKDNEKTLKQKFLSYNTVVLDSENEYLKDCIDKTCKQFIGTPEDVIVKTSMVC